MATFCLSCYFAQPHCLSSNELMQLQPANQPPTQLSDVSAMCLISVSALALKNRDVQRSSHSAGWWKGGGGRLLRDDPAAFVVFSSFLTVSVPSRVCAFRDPTHLGWRCILTLVLRNSPAENSSADELPQWSSAVGYKGRQELKFKEVFGCVVTARDL